MKAENKLRKSEERLRRLADLTYEGIIIHKGETIIDVNSTLVRMTRYSTEELIGKNFVKLIIPEKHHKIVFEMMQKDSAAPYEIEGNRKNGILFQIKIESKSIDYENEEEVRVTTIRNISNR